MRFFSGKVIKEEFVLRRGKRANEKCGGGGGGGAQTRCSSFVLEETSACAGVQVREFIDSGSSRDNDRGGDER